MNYSEYKKKKKDGTLTNEIKSSNSEMSYSEYKAYYKKEEDINEKLKNFFSDYSSFADSAQKDFTGLNYGNVAGKNNYYSTSASQLRERATDLRVYISSQKNNMSKEDYNKLMSSFDSIDMSLSQITGGYNRAYNHYSQFETEDEYNDVVKQSELYNMTTEEIAPYLDTSATDKKISALVSRQSEIKEQMKGLGNTGKGAIKKQKLQAELNDVNKQIKELNGTKGIAYTTLGGKNITWQSLYDNKKQEEEFNALYGELSSKDDWEELSQYISTNKKGTQRGNSILDWETDWDYEDVNKYSPYMVAGGFSKDWGYAQNTKDEEKAVFNYLYHTQGKDAAMEWHKSRENIYKNRIETEAIENAVKFAEDYPVLSDAIGIGASVLSGGEYIADVLTGNIADTNQMAAVSSAIKGTRMEQIDWEVGDWDAFDFLYSTTTSGLESMASKAMFGQFGGVALGLSAAAQSTNDALDRGMSKGQAFASGVASGIFEGIFESWSIGAFDDLTKNLKRADFRNLAKYIGKNMWNNAKEETLTEIANILYDTMANGGFSQAETAIRQYMNAGMSESDAKKKVALELGAQVVEAGASGALMGFGFSAGGVASTVYNTAKSGKAVKNAGEVGNLVNLGKSLGEGTESYDLANKINDKSSALAIGNLLGIAEDDILSANRGDVVKSLVRKGYTTEVANNLADLMLDPESNMFANSRGLTNEGKTYNDIINNPNSTVSQRSQAYVDIIDNLEKAQNKSKADPKAQPQTATVAPYSQEYVDSVAKELEAMGIPTEQAQILAQKNLSTPTETNSSPTEENIVESEYEVSADNKTINKKNDKIANIKNIESISEDGEANLTLDDGMVVKASDLAYGNNAEAIFIENIGKIKLGKSPISTTSANELYMRAMMALENNPDMTAEQAQDLIKGLEESYVYGAYNFGESNLTKNESVAFANKLPDPLRKRAYELGSRDNVSKTESSQKAIDKIKTNANPNSKKKHLGKIVFESKINEKALSPVKKANLNGIKLLAELTNYEFHVFESDENLQYKMPNGAVRSANGWYIKGTNEIWIDIKSGAFGEGTMLWTAGHEIGHDLRIKTPKQWQAMANLIMETFAKNDVDVKGMLNKQIAKIERRYKANNEVLPSQAELIDMAYEEMVSDALTDMLTDGSIVNFMAEVKAKDRNLWQKIGDAIKSLLEKWGLIIDSYKGRKLETAEAQALSQFEDVFKQIQEMYRDAIMEANEVNALANDIVTIDADSNSVAPMMSERTWTESEYVTEREKTAKAISSTLGVDIKVAYKYIDDINSVARLIADDRVRLDYDPNIDENATVLKKNSDYKYSVDMSTLCAKRLLTTGTFDAIQRKLPNTVFTSEDIVALREMMLKRGYEVACGICYVESTRREMGRITQDFIDSYIKSQKTGKPITRINSSNQAVELKKTNDEKLTTADKTTDKFYADKNYTPTLADLNTTDIDIVKKEHPLVYEAYLNFMNARGQAKPKLLETRAEYKGEILKHFKSKSAVNARNNAGGLRLQSFSDFEVPHLIDMMQIVMDMSRVGLMSQAYTKVPAFAEVFGNTGVKINLSLIAKGSGLDANGNLIFDDIEGINHNEAFKLRDKFSKNVGTIIVGKTDAHIIAAMADPRIDYIIPFHKSSWKESLYEALGLTGYADYTDFQNEKPIDNSRKIKNFDPSEYWDFSKSGDENAQIYLAKCREDGRMPKFPQFQGYPGYWKLLIDFKMYDNEGVGSPQEVVNPKFEMDAAETILNEYKGGHRNFPVAKDVVEDFVKGYEKNVMLSGRDFDGNTLSKEQQEFFKDSKVRDAKGRLIPVYHGTPSGGFTEFKLPHYLSSLTSAQGAGYYFTDKQNASQYMAGLNGKSVSKKALYKVYLNITNPLEISEYSTGAISDDAFRRIMARGNYEWGMAHTDVEKRLQVSKFDSDRLAEMVKVFNGEEILTVMKEELGYDGVHYTDKYGDIWVAWDKSQIKDTTNTNPTSNPDIRYSFRDSESGMANDALSPYNEELTRFIKQKGDYIVDGFDKLEQIVNLAFDDKSKKATAYFGIINAKTLDKIKNSIPNLPKSSKDILFKEGRDYSIATTLDSIRHIVDEKSLSREDVINYLDRLADTILEFDSVAFNFYQKGNNKTPGLLFKKNFSDGTLVSFDLVSQNKNSLMLQTLYMDSADYQKKKSAKTLPMQNANGNTSKTQVGQTSANIVAEDSDSVKKYSDRDSTYMDAVNNGDMETAQKMVDEVAKEAGYTVNGYHGTGADFNIFSEDKIGGRNVWGKGFYFGTNKGIADDYASWRASKGGNYRIVNAALKMDNPFTPHKSQLGTAEEILDTWFSDMWQNTRKLGVGYIQGKLENSPLDLLQFIAEHNKIEIRDVLKQYGYDSIKDGGEIVVFSPEQIKSADPVTYDDNGNVIPLSERFNTKNEDIRYSERDPEASNRAILANALEGVAQNDIEKNKLNEYKEKIGLINAEEQRLSEIQKQLFTKGGVEPKQRKALQFEAKQIANRINTYDRQLLRLEATKPLQSVLNREKEMARKRQKQKDAEAMSKYKEKVAQTTRELITRNQESRKKAIESREKTAMRHKIQKVVGDLNTLLLKPTKERHVPEELKIAVAEALSIVNLDTVDADTRVAKYNDLIAKAKDPDVIASLTATRDRILNQGNKLADKLTKLKDAYGKIQNSTDDSLRSMYDDVIYNKIESVQEKVGKTPLRNMTLAQLESVYELYKMVLTTVRDSNKAFAEDLKMTRQALGSNTFAEIKENNKARDTIKHPFLEKSLWQYLKPMQAMKTIGSGTLQKLWNNILYGQEVFAQDYDEAVKFAKEMKDKYGYKKWNLKKLYSFESKSGKTMKISLEQMMSIYAYSKRAQADEHIEYGGIVLNEGIIEEKNKLGKTVKVKVNDSTAYRLDRMQVGHIIDTLEKEAPGAKAFVDEMQKYLSETMGAKGNEVSMKMYGINLFKEEHYFPLKSSKDFMEAANAKLKGDVKIKNKGMTKATVEHARNPIVLENFLDVWGNHINEMAMYHGLVLPLEDFSRTLNYSFRADESLNTDAESVRTALHDALGDNADNYINELLKAINGGVLHDSSAQFADKMISQFKKAKVMASLSVVIQQPTAIIRAMGIIEPKYFTAQNFNHKQTWEELKKYCPTAIIKETGSFDTNMGRTIVDMIKDERGFTDKVGDALGKAPAWMDEMGWNMIWRALKNKVATEQKLSGEELLKECGKQMTLILNETQVYDSVMSRNELMRSKSTFTKMATAFMAEPTTVANMIYGAALDIKRGKKGIAGKTIAATVGSVVINGLVSAFVYALRDDDEDETFLEKYLSSATTEVLDGLNPLTYIPFIKDAYSLFQGYKVERTDMALIGDVYDALNTFYNALDPEAYEGMSRKEIAKHIYENSVPLLTSICDMFGLPVGNILRDAKAIITNDNIPMSQTSSAGTKHALKEGAMSALPKIVQTIIGTDSKQDKLYDAIVNGDTAYLKRLKSGYKDDKAYETAVRTALRKNDTRIKEAAQARIDGNIAEYTRIVREIKSEGFFSQDTIVASVNAEINAINKGESSPSSSNANDKASSIYKIDDYYASIVGEDQATAYVVKEDIINTEIENGKDRDEAESYFNSRFASYLREEYENGNLSEREAERMLVNYGGKSEEDAASKVQYWTFKQEYPEYDDLSEEAVEKYYNKVEPYGIGVDVYYDYSKQRSKCKGTDKNGDGKTDSGSVKSEVLRVINSLPISRSQKDALYYLNGWSAKTLYEAPWH